MLDFLRRLSPVRDADATRALPVMPSRFSVRHPLQDVDVDASDRHPDEGEIIRPPVPDRPDRAPAGHYFASLQPHADDYLRIGERLPPGTNNIPVEGHARNAGSPASASEELSGHARDVPIPSLDGVRNRIDDTPPDHARQPATHPASATSPATPALQQTSALPARAPGRGPLSQASLTQRTTGMHDDTSVVHVTIGRIDVVAQTVAPATPSHSPAPRQPSVTLSDYLRRQQSPGGHHGGRP